ncbi:heavy metal translocating P-type ATPase [Fusibacter sp. JL216-2]|uniref:heavy metal translocating P-type ATPase n=1 Tax=Fusibacter sp. JL216-2 TaxID=3071453 RepID=UPI003D332F0E
MTYQFTLDGLNCASCAQKIESGMQNHKLIESAELNFVTKELTLLAKSGVPEKEILDDTTKLVKKLEPHVDVIPKKQSRSMTLELGLEGLDCSSCASKIDAGLQKMPELKSGHLDFVSKKIVAEVESHNSLDETASKIRTLVHHYEPDVVVRNLSDGQLQTEDDNKPKFDFQMARLFTALGLFASSFLLKSNEGLLVTTVLLAYVIAGYPVIIKAFKGMKNGQLFDENFLMTVATLGALGLREWREAAAVMLFYEVGEAFQDRAVNNSRKSIKSLLNIKPDSARIISGMETKVVAPEQVMVGDKILVKPGEKVALDGIVLSGQSTLDTSALTGESIPRLVEQGDEVLSGAVNVNASITVEVTKPFSESTVSRIMKLVEQSASKKSETERFITKFSRYYTPVVVFSALALAIIPPLLFGGIWSIWIKRALIFLVVSCPCALVVSIPLGYFGGIGAASKKGILIKGGQYLDALYNLKTVVFDKTGTLTEGQFKVESLQPVDGVSDKQLLEWASLAEAHSNHPIAQSIIKESGGNIDDTQIESYEEIAGHGVRAISGTLEILAGNKRLMKKEGITFADKQTLGTAVHVAVNGVYKGFIQIADLPKADVEKALKALRDHNISHIEMLTGDTRSAAELTAKALDLDGFRAELLPEDKVYAVEELEAKYKKDGKLAFVGDGVNDAPVLARADVGIAMGGLGSDAAIEAADVVLMTDEPSKIADAIHISKFTRNIVLQNIVFALGIKLAVMALGAVGIATMWMAIFADVGVAILAILNATRILKV